MICTKQTCQNLIFTMQLFPAATANFLIGICVTIQLAYPPDGPIVIVFRIDVIAAYPNRYYSLPVVPCTYRGD